MNKKEMDTIYGMLMVSGELTFEDVNSGLEVHITKDGADRITYDYDGGDGDGVHFECCYGINDGYLWCYVEQSDYYCEGGYKSYAPIEYAISLADLKDVIYNSDNYRDGMLLLDYSDHSLWHTR